MDLKCVIENKKKKWSEYVIEIKHIWKLIEFTTLYWIQYLNHQTWCSYILYSKQNKKQKNQVNRIGKWNNITLIQLLHKTFRCTNTPPLFKKNPQINKQTNKTDKQTKQNKRNTGFLKIKFPFVRLIFNYTISNTKHSLQRFQTSNW